MSMPVSDSREYLVEEGCSLTCCNGKTIGRRAFIIIISIVGAIIVGLTIAVIVLAVTRPSSSPSALTQCESPECNLQAAQLLYRLNQSVNPCNDFYRYACGQGVKDWIVSPPAYLKNDFSQQQDKINDRIQEILKGSYEDNPILEKPIKVYSSCLNQNDTSSALYLQELLNILGGLPMAEGESWNNANPMSTIEDVFHRLISFSKYRQGGVLFTLGVTPDLRNTSRNLPMFIKPSKGNLYPMADRENLTRMIEPSFIHVAQYFNSSVTREAVINDLNQVLDVSAILYEALPEKEPEEIDYQVMTIAEFTKETNNKVNWLGFLNGVFKDITATPFLGDGYVGIQGLAYFKNVTSELSRQFNQSVGRGLINFELSQLLLSLSSYTQNKEFVAATAQLRKVRTSGSEDAVPPQWWLSCIQWTSNWFGYALANEYAERFIDIEKVVQASEELTTYITQAYEDRLSTLEWLDDKAHKGALDKIHQMTKLYNYPGWSSDAENIMKYYEDFKVSEDHVENSVEAQKFAMKRNYLRVNGDGPDSLKSWPKSPITVNAYYMPAENSITIPQGMLQSPVFGADRLRIMNFGSLGSIIGHEITHGFDLNGRFYDGKGNLAAWMDSETLLRFKQKAECFVKQYAKYSLTEDDIPRLNNVLQINGLRTVSENIADGGGVRNAYWAYKKWEEDNGLEVVPNFLKKFSNDQLFFISYANNWCTKYADATPGMEAFIKSDVHCPGRIRVLGALSNFKEFSDAFSCAPGDVMNPENRCILW